MSTYRTAEEGWRALLTGELREIAERRRIFRFIPTDPRCKICNAPFHGIGAPFMRLIGRGQWPKNPRYCTGCFTFLRSMPGGAEVELSMLFADVRGSTPLAERLGPSAFSKLINRFFSVASELVVQSDGVVEKFVGDEVTALYIPGWAGPQHARVAIDTGLRLLRATGHGERGGPWVPIGIGVHTGTAYVGTVGDAEGVNDFAALGDAANTAARLAGVAREGELLASETACRAAGLDVLELEQRDLELKGKREPVRVRVLRVAPS